MKPSFSRLDENIAMKEENDEKKLTVSVFIPLSLSLILFLFRCAVTVQTVV